MSTGTIIAAAMLTVLVAALLSMCALIDEEKDRRGREISQQNTARDGETTYQQRPDISSTPEQTCPEPPPEIQDLEQEEWEECVQADKRDQLIWNIVLITIAGIIALLVVLNLMKERTS